MADLLETLGRIAVSIHSAPQGVSGRIWDELRPWLARLAVHAAPKWLPTIGYGFPCHVPVYQGGMPVAPCPRAAIAACDVCGEPCCLDHARIDQYGDAICYLCVAEAFRVRQAQKAQGVGPGATGQPGPRPAEGATGEMIARELAWARKTLGVKKATPWDDVRQAHRKLSAKWHPDRSEGDEAKFKEVQRAFDLLGKERERKEAA